jgi:RNA polymerase sigma-70 factor (ECF subfamily)
VTFVNITPLAPDLEHHFQRERGRLLALARRIVGDPDLAEDVLQESLLRALHAAPDLDYAEPIAPWLFAVVRNAALDAYRRERRAADALARYAREAAEPPGDPPLPAEEAAEVCACVLDLVPTLKPAYAAVIEADLAGRDPEAVADELGVTRNNLKVRRHRARQQLRERLEATCRLCATHGCLDCTCKTPDPTRARRSTP